MNWSPLNVLLQMLFGGGVLLGLAAIVVAAVKRKPRLAGLSALVLAGWVSIYVAAVLGVSLTSREVQLARGQTKHFCGFYIDCHLGVAVDSVNREPGPGGTLYRVNLRFVSDARRASLTLYRPGIHLVDGAGRVFQPRPSPASPSTLSEPIEAGGSYTTQLAFDLPADARDPRLLVTEMEDVWPDKLFEMFLIGDEDSVLHKKTTLQI